MTCGSIMTRNPSCCLAGDSVSTAARIMKQQDVGPVLVVADHSSMKLVGIITDRDIAVSVVAEGRDAHSTKVESIMSSDPVTCSEDEDVMTAVKRMADYQIRRIAVVDGENCVVGIVSQADVARNAQEEQVGEMVEEISQPWGLGEWPEGKYSGQAKRSTGLDAGSALAIGALCVGFGAGLMYIFDPSRGRKRRAQFADRSNELWTHRSEVLQRTKEAITDKAQSVVTSTKAKLGVKTPQTPQTEPGYTGQAGSAGLYNQ